MNEELEKLREGLLKAMPEWEFDPSSSNWLLRLKHRAQGWGLHIQVSNGKRFEIGADVADVSWRDVLPWGVKSPGITVARDRTPEAIAKEITRRLLPELALYSEAAKQVIVKREKAKTDLEARKKRFAALGGEECGNGGDNVRFCSVASEEDPCRMDLNAGRSIRIETFYAPEELAVEFARLIVGYDPKREKEESAFYAVLADMSLANMRKEKDNGGRQGEGD